MRSDGPGEDIRHLGDAVVPKEASRLHAVEAVCPQGWTVDGVGRCGAGEADAEKGGVVSEEKALRSLRTSASGPGRRRSKEQERPKVDPRWTARCADVQDEERTG